MADPASLILREEAQAHEFNDDLIIIGTSRMCSLRLEGELVSKRHATFRLEKGAYILYDLGGPFGTFHNGSPVNDSIRVKTGDTLKVGTHTFTIESYPENYRSGPPQEEESYITQLMPPASRKPPRTPPAPAPVKQDDEEDLSKQTTQMFKKPDLKPGDDKENEKEDPQ